MENIKSIVIFENETSGKYIYVVKSLKEDSSGKQYVGTDVIEFDKKQNFLPGQEVTIGRTLTSQGTPGCQTIFPKEPSKKANYADQYKRLHNLKSMIATEIVTDNEEILWDEYKKQKFDVKHDDFTKDFPKWYSNRLLSYSDAAHSILCEGRKIDVTDPDHDYIFSNAERKKLNKANDTFNNICSNIYDFAYNDDNEYNINSIIKETSRLCQDNKYIDKYFLAVSMLLNPSNDLENSNKSGRTM